MLKFLWEIVMIIKIIFEIGAQNIFKNNLLCTYNLCLQKQI